MIPSICRVHIDWSSFRHNLRILMRKGKKLMPVIKADAYGHGVLRASEELYALGIEWAAVSTLEEGAQVREHGYGGNIVSLVNRYIGEEELKLAKKHRIIPLVHDWDGLHSLKAALRSSPGDTPFRFALKLDSGMGRLGFFLDQIEDVAAKVAEGGLLDPVLLLSHFSVADDPDENSYTERQAETFFKAADILKKRFPGMLCSLGNTAGLASHTDIAGDICRPGLALYGYSPLFGTSLEKDCEGLRPVMSVSTTLFNVHPVRKGESVGYGRAFTADSDRLVGWAAIGYSDGYRRNPAPGTCMCINGVRVPVIGRVAMQTTCLDLTDLPFEPKVGDRVYVMGGPGDAVSAQELADWWNTIPYEVICLLGKNTREE